MLTHYEVLEVPEQATAHDIRRAYRRLVLLTHPDRTPDPAAHQRYLAINRAYEVLSLPPERQAYDARLWALRNPFPPVAARPRVVPHPDPAYRGPMPRPVRRVSLQERYAPEYARLLGWLRPIMLASMALCLLFLVDYSLARDQTERVEVTSVDVYYRGGSKYNRGPRHIYFRHQTDRGRFDSDESVAAGEIIQVRRTPLIGKALRVARRGGGDVLPTNLYTEAWIMPWLLFLAAALTQLPKFNNDVRLGISLLTLVFLVVTLYLLLAA